MVANPPSVCDGVASSRHRVDSIPRAARPLAWHLVECSDASVPEAHCAVGRRLLSDGADPDGHCLIDGTRPRKEGAVTRQNGTFVDGASARALTETVRIGGVAEVHSIRLVSRSASCSRPHVDRPMYLIARHRQFAEPVFTRRERSRCRPTPR